MKKLKVLIHDIGVKNPDFDYSQSGTKGLYPLLKELHKLIDFEEIWVYQAGGVNSREYDLTNKRGYFAFAFHDGIDMMDKLKPDLIITRSDYEFLTRGIMLGGKARGIPSIVLISIRPYVWDKEVLDMKMVVKGRFHWLWKNGKNIIKRYNFLLKTIRQGGYGLWYAIKTIASDFRLTFETNEPTFRLGLGDLYLSNNVDWKNHMMRYGIDENRIIIVGECAMDLLYEKITTLNRIITSKKKILFITTSMVEHGQWTARMRDELVTKAVGSIKQELPDYDLKIKIQPGEPLEHYKTIVKPIDPSIDVMEFGDLTSLIYDADVIVSFALSTAMFDALLLKKPIFLLNLFNQNQSSNFLITEKMATECKKVDEFITYLKNETYPTIDPEKLGVIIEKQMYKFDGKSSHRAAASIAEFLSKKKLDYSTTTNL